MINKRLLVVGAGGHACLLSEAAEFSGQFVVVCFLDDAVPASERVLGGHVHGIAS